MKKLLFISIIVLLLRSNNLQASWTEPFDIGLGRFQYTDSQGDSVFTWNSSSKSLDATFIRSQPVDRRYASIPEVEDLYQGCYGFSTVITITGEVPGAQSDPACGMFGFYNTFGSEHYGFVLVEAEILNEIQGYLNVKMSRHI